MRPLLPVSPHPVHFFHLHETFAKNQGSMQSQFFPRMSEKTSSLCCRFSPSDRAAVREIHLRERLMLRSFPCHRKSTEELTASFPSLDADKSILLLAHEPSQAKIPSRLEGWKGARSIPKAAATFHDSHGKASTSSSLRALGVFGIAFPCSR